MRINGIRYIAVYVPKDDTVIGFEATPACNHSHCPYSANRNIPLHGHFIVKKTSTEVWLLPYLFGEQEALERLDQFQIPEDRKTFIRQQIFDLFHQPPPHVIRLPEKKAA